MTKIYISKTEMEAPRFKVVALKHQQRRGSEMDCTSLRNEEILNLKPLSNMSLALAVTKPKKNGCIDYFSNFL